MNTPDVDLLLKISIPEILEKFGEMNPRDVALKKNLPLPAHLLTDILIAHKKAPSKFPTWYNKSLILLKSETEQASGEIAARKKASLIPETSVADLTCALGFDSLAFLKAGKTVFCSELNNHTLKFAQKNHQTCDVVANEYRVGNAEMVWRDFVGKANAIYLDPMRRSGSERLTNIQDFQPDFSKIVGEALPYFQSIWVKLSPMLDISFLLTNFKNISEVHVISVDDECKEILIRFQENITPVQKWVHICKSNGAEISFQTNLSDFNPISESSESDRFVVIPDAAIRKWTISDQIAAKLRIETVFKNTHIFISDNKFPQIGRHFRLLHQSKIRLSEIREKLEQFNLKRVSFDLHNVPFSEAIARKKSGVKDGPDGHIILYSDDRKSLHCLVCSHLSNESIKPTNGH